MKKRKNYKLKAQPEQIYKKIKKRMKQNLSKVFLKWNKKYR